MNENIKKIKNLLNEFIAFLNSHDAGELTRADFKQWVYLYHSDAFILSCAINDELFNKFLKEINE